MLTMEGSSRAAITDSRSKADAPGWRHQPAHDHTRTVEAVVDINPLPVSSADYIALPRRNTLTLIHSLEGASTLNI